MCSDVFVMPSSWGRSTASASWKPAGVLGLPEPLISAPRLPAKRAILVPSVPAAYLPPSSHVPHLARTTHTHPKHTCHTSYIQLTKSHIKNVTIKVFKEDFKGWICSNDGGLQVLKARETRSTDILFGYQKNMDSLGSQKSTPSLFLPMLSLRSSTSER